MIANSPQAWSERAVLEDRHAAVMWSPEGQQERFTAVLRALQPRSGESLLDYGCGTGDLTEALPEGIEYTGYDWSHGMVERARADHPDFEFTDALYGQFDLTACIGTFNLADNWSIEQTWSRLAFLWTGTLRAMAVSLYCGQDENCLHYEPAQVMGFAGLCSDRCSVTRYRSNDILLVMWNPTD